jgi:hypothetical protein
MPGPRVIFYVFLLLAPTYANASSAIATQRRVQHRRHSFIGRMAGVEPATLG